MELILNCVWFLVVVLSAFVWLRQEWRTLAERHLSLVATAMLVMILFPVISVSDDLWSLHNPAETDICQRRDHKDSCSHTILPTAATLPETVFAQPDFDSHRLQAPQRIALVVVEIPALGSIQNRPPPAA